MNQTPPTPEGQQSGNFDPQTGQPLGQNMGHPGSPYGQPVVPGAPNTEGYPQGYPAQPYPPQGGQPYQTYGYAPKEPSGAGLFFGWIFDFNLKNSAAKPAHKFAYTLVLLAVIALAIAHFVDAISYSIYLFGYGDALSGIWVLLSNLVGIPLITLAILGIARLGFDALTKLSAGNSTEEN